MTAARVFAQSVDYLLHFPDEQRRAFAQLSYENDVFAATDRYYSQGIVACYKRPVGDSSNFRGFFLPMKKSRRQVGFGIDHMVFTPSSILSDSIPYYDHPYAGTLRLNAMFETIDTARDRSLAWTFSIGVIGPEALGYEMQTLIHKTFDNPLPQGWKHQLNSGLLIDAGIHGEHRAPGTPDWLIIVMDLGANAGTSRIDLTFGSRLGVMFASHNNFFRIHLYMNPAFRFVGYDATLQGSLISRSSDYFVPASDVTRVVFEREFGISGRFKHLQISGTYQMHSNNYRQGMMHRWGGLRVGWYF
jgi:lipid A 3-O-deacylase